MTESTHRYYKGVMLSEKMTRLGREWAEKRCYFGPFIKRFTFSGEKTLVYEAAATLLMVLWPFFLEPKVCFAIFRPSIATLRCNTSRSNG